MEIASVAQEQSNMDPSRALCLGVVWFAVVGALDGSVVTSPQCGLALGALEARFVEDFSLNGQPVAWVHCHEQQKTHKGKHNK